MFMAFLVLVAGTVFVGLLAVSAGFSISTWSHVKNNDVINSGSRVFLDGASCPLGEDRRREAYTVREAIAYAEYARGVPCHSDNGDEALYAATRAGSFSKGKDCRIIFFACNKRVFFCV
jgi:hypothetical protein